MQNLRPSYSKNRPNRRFDMKSNSVLFDRTGNNPTPSSVNATVAVTSLELRVNASSRSSRLSGAEKRGLAALQHGRREGEFWETVIFGTLGMCGAASTVLALLRIAADR